jgi:plastocyanin
MRRMPFVFLAALVLVVGLGVGLGMAASGSGPASGALVKSEGRESMQANVLIQATLRWEPGIIKVPSGTRITWVHSDETRDPHTITIVKKWPQGVSQVFGCGSNPNDPCSQAFACHFGGGTLVTKCDDTPGNHDLDSPGDSLLLFPGQRIGEVVSAPPGSVLLYFCAIHPWMQGKIIVS